MDLILRKTREARTESPENRNHQCKLFIIFPQKDQNRKLIMRNTLLLLLSNEQSQKRIQGRSNEDKNQKYRRQDKAQVLRLILISLNQLLDINIKFEKEDFQAFTIQKFLFKSHCPCSVAIKKCHSQTKESNHSSMLSIQWLKINLPSKFTFNFRSTTMFQSRRRSSSAFSEIHPFADKLDEVSE